MRLPGKLLGSLRVGLGATALLVPGCDAAAETAAEVTQALNAPTPDLATTAMHNLPLVATAQRFEDADKGLGTELADRVAQARRAQEPRFEPPRTEGDDPTAFVPFSEDRSRIRPIRPRVETPRARPRPRRPVAVAPVPVAKPPKTWHCPACGRG